MNIIEALENRSRVLGTISEVLGQTSRVLGCLSEALGSLSQIMDNLSRFWEVCPKCREVIPKCREVCPNTREVCPKLPLRLSRTSFISQKASSILALATEMNLKEWLSKERESDWLFITIEWSLSQGLLKYRKG